MERANISHICQKLCQDDLDTALDGQVQGDSGAQIPEALSNLHPPCTGDKTTHGVGMTPLST